jgi:hypothetical protein
MMSHGGDCEGPQRSRRLGRYGGGIAVFPLGKGQGITFSITPRISVSDAAQICASNVSGYNAIGASS